jgi:hypothetical protein
VDTPRRASGYDLFKLIVAILLLLLFLLLMWRPPTTAGTVIPSTATRSSTPSQTFEPNPVAVDVTSTLSPLRSTSTPVPSPTQTLTPTPTDSLHSPTPTRPVTPTASQTPVPSLTATPVIESTSGPGEEGPSTIAACDAAASRARLQPGMHATIVRRLNFRSSPGIRDNWLRTNIPGTQVEIVGGPECIPHNTGAYLWWQIKLPDGEIGWSAEGSLHGAFYFMEP